MSQKAIDEINKIREEMARKFGKTTRTVTFQIDHLIAIQVVLKNALENFMQPDVPPTELDIALKEVLAVLKVEIGK
jgi:hypothetical protein